MKIDNLGCYACTCKNEDKKGLVFHSCYISPNLDYCAGVIVDIVNKTHTPTLFYKSNGFSMDGDFEVISYYSSGSSHKNSFDKIKEIISDMDHQYAYNLNISGFIDFVSELKGICEFILADASYLNLDDSPSNRVRH